MKHLYFILLIGLLILSSESTVLGQSSYSVKINNPTSAKTSQIQLFPNPASERFTISIADKSLKYITINNIIGKEVKRLASTPNNTFEVGDLKRGIYIIRIFDDKDELIKALRLSKT